MFDEDQQRLEDRKLAARQLLEQSQKQLTCDVISVGMLRNYKIRYNDATADMTSVPAEITDYVRLLERVIEPAMTNHADNVNVAAYIKGVVDEIVIELPPILTEPIAPASATTSIDALPMNTSEIWKPEHKVVSYDDFEELSRRVSKLESLVSERPATSHEPVSHIGGVYHGRDGTYDPVDKYLKNMSSSSFLDINV